MKVALVRLRHTKVALVWLRHTKVALVRLRHTKVALFWLRHTKVALVRLRQTKVALVRLRHTKVALVWLRHTKVAHFLHEGRPRFLFHSKLASKAHKKARLTQLSTLHAKKKKKPEEGGIDGKRTEQITGKET